ncbi:MAG: hypothetical protein K6F58_02570 [Bacteroidales bacterium]|nr:hypothetical protein [Bacteroidales bacterium]
MGNHFHFILLGEESSCDVFAENFKKLTAMWVSRHRGSQLSEPIIIGHWFVSPDKLGNRIVYVLRNPTAAGLRVVPHGYRWSSAHLMFSEWKPKNMKKASEISERARNKILNSTVSIPGDWFIADNMVWPGSVVSVPMAEKAFKTIGQFMFDLNNGNNDRDAETEMKETHYSLPDSELRIRAQELAAEYYRRNKLSECNVQERLGIAKLLKKETWCNDKQLGRVLHLMPQD